MIPGSLTTPEEEEGWKKISQIKALLNLKKAV
jgi:hypothetical protein